MLLLEKFKLLKRYLKYRLNAKDEHGVHSPFVFDLLTNTIYNNEDYYEYDNIEIQRRLMLSDNRKIAITDLGAGSINNISKKRSIKDIAKNSAKSQKYAQLLFRLVNHFQPNTMLELGTSLGISALYQHKANTKASFITHEGCPNTAAIAQENFDALKANNIKVVVGNFDETLSKTLATINQLDWGFFDGNHQKEPTIEYFEKSLTKAHSGSVFIFDDIHWSEGMEEAWEHIKNHPRVTISIDLFFIGIVFFREGRTKEHFTLKF